MYDELIKRLRCTQLGKCENCKNSYLEQVEPNLYRERCAAIDAADAIEELDMITDNLNYLYKEATTWIPVTERLPEDLKFVLAVEDGTVVMAHCEHYYGEEEVYVEWHDTMYYPVSPTHWMPLPEPPKEEA